MGRYTGPRERLSRRAGVPPWLLADTEALIGRVVNLPQRDKIQAPIEEQMIVEFYSRV